MGIVSLPARPCGKREEVQQVMYRGLNFWVEAPIRRVATQFGYLFLLVGRPKLQRLQLDFAPGSYPKSFYQQNRTRPYLGSPPNIYPSCSRTTRRLGSKLILCLPRNKFAVMDL
jgi:hypothetical protein